MKKLKYSIVLDATCQGKDPLKAMEEVKEAGFSAFEFWNYADKDLPAMKAKANALGLSCITFGWMKKFVNLTDPKEHETWIEELKESIDAAKIMGNRNLGAPVGNDTGAPRDFQYNSIIKAFKTALPIIMENNITLNIEPLNTRINHAGTYLESSDEAFAILDDIGSDNVKLLFDIYHQQISEGDIINRMLKRIKQIGHIHCAGSDGRHELDKGELNYLYIFKALSEADYDDYIGLEWFPVGDSLSTLKRMYEYLHK